MEPGSSYRQIMEKLFCFFFSCEGGKALVQIAQRDCGVSILRDIGNQIGHLLWALAALELG